MPAKFSHLATPALSSAVTSNPNCCSFRQNEIRAIKNEELLRLLLLPLMAMMMMMMMMLVAVLQCCSQQDSLTCLLDLRPESTVTTSAEGSRVSRALAVASFCLPGSRSSFAQDPGPLASSRAALHLHPQRGGGGCPSLYGPLAGSSVK